MIEPATTAFVLLPTTDKTSNARRLCKLVTCIAVAKNNAAATSATAELENPLNAIFNAFCVPNIASSANGFPATIGLPIAAPNF